MSSPFRFIACVVAVVALRLSASADPAPAELGPKGAAIADTGGEVVVTVPMSRPVPWSVLIADGPPRLIVEFDELELNREPRLASGSVSAVSTGRPGPGKSRFEAMLREPLAISTAEMQTQESGAAVLTVRLHPTTAGDFRAAMESGEHKIAAPERLVVALDPGHGGFDPGAQAGGLDEADLVLDFALRLRQVLEANGRFQVVLTRNDDRFVPLNGRISAARAAGADVFLALHADALEDEGGASGLVVYSLDTGLAGEAAETQAERHGPKDLLSGVDLTGAGEDVTLALLSLAQAGTVPRSRALSRSLVTAFDGAGLDVNSRPERAGGYAVLMAADIPSVLVELGFLSTKADLERLTSTDWQDRAAVAIRDALMLWADEDRLVR